jgi:hypothetical protein
MRRNLRNVSRAAFMFLPFGLVLSFALVTGCDSTIDPDSPEAKAQTQATAAAAQKADEAANEQIKKKGGKNTATLRNMKGRLGAAPVEDAKPSQ